LDTEILSRVRWTTATTTGGREVTAETGGIGKRGGGDPHHHHYHRGTGKRKSIIREAEVDLMRNEPSMILNIGDDLI
jgi:hypothetical protein